MSNKYLFLDDVRMPIDAYGYTKFELFKDKEWDVVRNYNEFVRYIEENGLPKFISFDHDLADSHYTPEHLWEDYNASKEWQESQVHTERTGAHCADFIVMHCIRTGQELPEYYCHSMNPVGKDKIINKLKEFESLRESFQKFENYNACIDDLIKELDQIQSKGIGPGEWDRLADFFEEIHAISMYKRLYKTTSEYKYKRGMRKSYSKHKKKKS